MIKFATEQKRLILEYTPENRSGGWIWNELKNNGEVTISRVFTLERKDLLEEPNDNDGNDEFVYRFSFATRNGDYYQIAGRVLGISSDVMIISSGITFERKLFASERNVSIFRRLSAVIGTNQDIVVGGGQSGSIPIEDFEYLRQKFPNSTELDRYANARVANIIGEYFEGMKDFRTLYESYLSQRKSVVSKDALDTGVLLRAEIDKFVFIRDTINRWLESSDGRSEKEWQRKILEFILLIFPKYVAVLENVQIEDHYSTPGSTRTRFIDVALVDANGNLDVIEIKRPFDDVLLSKTQYRDNFVPTKDLSGTIMQAEKYLFHLSKWGVAGEDKLTRKYEGTLPTKMSIKITNPKALLILGRDRKPDGSSALDQRQIFDLELIKRKYANMMDIITYDDLLRRLDNIIASLRQRSATSLQSTNS